MMLSFPALPVLVTDIVPFFQGFTIDGQAWDNTQHVGKNNAERAFRDILLYVAGERRYPGDAPRRIGMPP